MASRSHHGSMLCQNPTTKQFVPLPIRSVHIKPLPIETDPTDVLLGLPRGKPRNSVNRNLATSLHELQLAPEYLLLAISESLLADLF